MGRNALLTVGARKTGVPRTTPLTIVEAEDSFREVFAPAVRCYAGLGAWIVRHVDKINIDDPVGAARGRPVFELVLLSYEDRDDAAISFTRRMKA